MNVCLQDVPWSAVKIVELPAEEDVRARCGRMLQTRDDWRVSLSYGSYGQLVADQKQRTDSGDEN